jgi:hypothetical protein
VRLDIRKEYSVQELLIVLIVFPMIITAILLNEDGNRDKDGNPSSYRLMAITLLISPYVFWKWLICRSLK